MCAISAHRLCYFPQQLTNAPRSTRQLRLSTQSKDTKCWPQRGSSSPFGDPESSTAPLDHTLSKKHVVCAISKIINSFWKLLWSSLSKLSENWKMTFNFSRPCGYWFIDKTLFWSISQEKFGRLNLWVPFLRFSDKLLQDPCIACFKMLIILIWHTKYAQFCFGEQFILKPVIHVSRAVQL